MDYKTWSCSPPVPLTDEIVARKTGLHYMKSPQEISDYYRDNFGNYWFNVLPKTDNTYNPTSKYYGCTLAPGVPLIPNLSRRPLRSLNSSYDYSFESSSSSEKVNTTDTWKNNFYNERKENGFTPTQMTHIPSPSYDSDSDYDEDLLFKKSQNQVTWFSWIITTITTIITVITETFLGRHQTKDHFLKRSPLKQHAGVSWYQYPFLWLYKLALAIQRFDVWFLAKLHSVLRLDSWGTPEQRRRWTFIILLIPLLLWAGVFIADGSFPSSETFLRYFNVSNWEAAFFSPIESLI